MRSLRQGAGNIIFWAIYPGVYLKVSNTPRVRVIISVGDRVLFVNQWLGTTKQSLPGGGVHKNETSSQAAVREIHEELGITIVQQDLKVVTKDLSLKEAGIKYMVDCYHVTLPKTVDVTLNPLEIVKINWEPWAEMIDTKRLSTATNLLLHAWLGPQHLID
jgi:8-oxo-dGTP diphosphatase